MVESQSFLNSSFVQDGVKPLAITIGLYFLLKAIIFLLDSLYYFWKVYIQPSISYEYTLRKDYGDYVVINNVTDVIGTEFAKAFLLKGHSLVLIVGKNDDRYDTIMPILEECRVKGGGQIVVILKDADKCDADVYNTIKTEIENSDYRNKIGILLNNGGIVEQHYENFLQFSDKFVNNTVHTNIVDFLMITKMVLNIMKDNYKGLIVNVTVPENCNFFTESGFPISMRDFTDKFERIISREFADFDRIKVEAIHPGSLCLEGCHEDRLHPTPEKFVESAMKRLGRTKETAGYIYHSLENFFEYFIPEIFYSIAYHIRRQWIKLNSKKDSKDYEALN